MSDSTIQIVQQIYAAFGRGDVPGIMEHISDELQYFGVVSEKMTHDHGVHRFTFKNGKVIEWFGTEDTAKTSTAYNA